MKKHRIDHNETYINTVSIRPSDKYRDSIYVVFDRHYVVENVTSSNDMFVTPDELESLGLFFVEQARVLKGK